MLKTPINKRGYIVAELLSPNSTCPSQLCLESQLRRSIFNDKRVIHLAWELMIMQSARLANHHLMIVHVHAPPCSPASVAPPTQSTTNIPKSDRHRLKKKSTFPPQILNPAPHATISNSSFNAIMATVFLPSPSKPLRAASAPLPTPKHPGERLADYFDTMFQTITAISTLGASLTFSKVVSTPTEPWVYHGLTAAEIQYYIADAFVCFALALFLTTLAASALSNWRPQAIKYFGTEDSHRRRIVAWWATGVSTVLIGLTITAFIFMGIVIGGLVGNAGWVALACTGLMGVVVLVVIVWQSPIGSPPPHAHRDRKRHKLHKPMPTYGGRYGSYHSSEGSMPDDQFVVGEYVSEEKIDVFSDPGGNVQGYRRQEEEYGFEEDVGRGTYVDGAGYRDARPYVEEPLSRSSTLARPTMAAVPPYTEDLRRMRQIKASEEYDGRYGS